MNPQERRQARKLKLEGFDPDRNGLMAHGLFGLPFTEEESEIVMLPVPWEVTVSYGEGTARGPQAIMKASQQIDLYDPIYPHGWRCGLSMRHIPEQVLERNEYWRAQTGLYLQEVESEDEVSRQAASILSEANKATAELVDWVERKSLEVLDSGRILGILGGEHSTPLGAMRAQAKRHEEFGILQIDAHADLRKAYQGFTHSHASIMWNAIQIPQVSKLVQVGIRDFSQGELEVIQQSNGRVVMFSDHEMNKCRYEGDTWAVICRDIISNLPEKVYVSFDIDGLHPWLCPNTGTPVPGGLLLEEAAYLLERVVTSGRKIIGFDLCEVAPGPDEWDGNVGARVLYKLCLLALRSNGIEP